jgi:polynucleotide 5'-hydroxyl-kinase GRC3/NOL9
MEHVLKARTTVVVGSTDTGKTTLIKKLANEILKGGKRCAIVDADMGQSDIGPPSTIGLGKVHAPIKDMGEVEVVGIYFVGSISPKGHLLQTIVGTKKMVDKALNMDFDHILIDTTGLVNGPIGHTLKGHKIDILQPDLIVFIQRGSECEYLIKRFYRSLKYRSIILSPSSEIIKKTLSERKAYRKKAIMNYFINKRRKEIDLNSIFLVDFPFFTGTPLKDNEKEAISKKIHEVIIWAESIDNDLHIVTIDPIGESGERLLREKTGKENLYFHNLGHFENILVGLYNREGEFFSLGVVKDLDFKGRRVILDVAHDSEEVCGIKFSRLKIDDI